MSFCSPDGVRAAAGATWVARGAAASASAELVGVSIDSRTIRPGEVFVALPGERFDGHDYIPAALNAGAGMLIVERPETAAAERIGRDVPVVRVADTRKALGRLARAWREELTATRVVAVAGSNGKTTTVRLIEAILSVRLRGAASRKSFNNDIGVPLTILRARAGDQYLVCEVGMNAPGEMSRLASIVAPDVAVITAVQREHLEFLGGLEGVARENGALLAFLRPGGVAVTPAGESLLADYLKSAPGVVTFGADASADLRVTSASHVRGVGGGVGVRFTLNERWTFDVPLVGLHNAGNAAAAIAVARRFGLDDETIRAGLASVQGPEMRMQRRVIAGVEVYNDAYNSNPDSAIAAVRTFAEIARGGSRRVIVLGDMLELGEHAGAGHAEVADVIADADAAEVVITVGPLAREAGDRLRRRWGVERVASVEDAALPEPTPHGHRTGDRPSGAERIASMLRAGDIVLLKGSRGVGLERVEAALAAQRGGAGVGLAEPKQPVGPSLFPAPPSSR